MADVSIEEELITATGITRIPDESEQFFLERLVKKVDTLHDDDWDKLSREAQLWVNAAITAGDNEQPLPLLPGTEEEHQKQSIRSRVQELILADPKLKQKEILDKLTKEGIKTNHSTVQLEMSAFRSACKFLWRQGVLRREIIK